MKQILALLGAVLISIGMFGCSGGSASDAAPSPPVSDDLEWDQGNWDEDEWV